MAEARIIDGKAIAAGLQRSVAEAAAALREDHGITPGLAAVLVGDDPASQVYVRSKARACAAAGLASFEHRLSANCGPAAILELVARLNADERVDGILVQLPLPAGADRNAVIDVGISRIIGPDGTSRLLGDVDFAAVRAVAGALTPVPGGVGPMTIACLLRNTLLAACRRRGLPDLLSPIVQ